LCHIFAAGSPRLLGKEGGERRREGHETIWVGLDCRNSMGWAVK